MTNVTSKRFTKSPKFWIYLVFVTTPISIFVWWHWFHNSLPNDAEMLRHFSDHRAGYEQLVQGYLNYRPSRTLPASVAYEQIPEVKALMRELEIYHIVGAQGASGSWYPNPYSHKTVQTLRSLHARPINQLPTNEEIMKTLRVELPILFEQAQMPLRDIGDISRVTTPMHLQPGSEQQPDDRLPLKYYPTRLHKGYYYFPQPPKLENGHVMVPSINSRDPGYRLGQRVFESLDDYPANWAKGECVLKRINLHWFISMCRTA